MRGKHDGGQCPRVSCLSSFIEFQEERSNHTPEAGQQSGGKERRMASSRRYRPYSTPDLVGDNLGMVRAEHRAEVRARYPDHANCSNLHPQPLGRRNHTNGECFKQKWRHEQQAITSAQRAPEWLQPAVPPPAAPPATVQPAMVFNAPVAIFNDASSAREGAMGIFQMAAAPRRG